MNRWRLSAVTMAAGACALGASPCAAAGRATYQMPVSVNPVAGCTISAAPLVFALPVPVNANVDSTSLITVRCTPFTAYVIDIDNGLHPQGNNRRVHNVSANDYMTYDVYKDPPRSQVWGKGNLKNVSGNSGLLGIVAYPIYGRLNARATAKSGAYTDTLTITVTF